MQVEYIIAEPPSVNGNETEAIETVAPLATSLGIMIDTPWCASAPSLSHLPIVLMDLVSERDDKDCVGEALAAYALDHPTASMLVAWEMVRLPDIAEALGAGNVPEWPAKW